MELLTYLPLGLIIDVSTCMDNITFKIRLQYMVVINTSLCICMIQVEFS